MSRVLTAAAYATHNMPLGTTFDAPILADDESYDVAGYIVSQNQPEKRDLDKDFPERLQKPVDTPYGPYADGFSTAQNKLGPFGLIRAKVMSPKEKKCRNANWERAIWKCRRSDSAAWE